MQASTRYYHDEKMSAIDNANVVKTMTMTTTTVKDQIVREKKKSFSLSKTKVAYIESVTRDDHGGDNFAVTSLP